MPGVPTTLMVGQSVPLTVQFSQSGNCTAADRVVSWSLGIGRAASIVSTGARTATLTASATTEFDAFTVSVGGTPNVYSFEVVTGPVTAITISPANPVVATGAAQQMTVTFLNPYGGIIPGDGAKLTWSVVSPSLASWSGSGLLTAGAASGVGTITATYTAVTPSLVASTGLTVSGSPQTAASISVDPPAPSLNVGSATQLTATVKDAQGHTVIGGALSWQNLTPGLITLSPGTGSTVTVTAIAAGTGTIRVAAVENSSAQKDVTVTVAGCLNPLVISDDFSTDTPGAWTTSFTRANTSMSDVVTYKPSAGNPGGYREMAHNMIGTGSLYVYHLREVEFDPSVAGNTIHHINYHEDQLSIASAIGWGFFIEQNGVRHLKSVGTAVFNSPAWQTNSILSMTQADFPNVNFSATGGKIKFGFYRANTSTGGIYTTTHGIDNFNVQVCRQ